MWQLNRNQYFLAGLIVLMLGLQLRVVEGFVLNERATQVLHQRLQQIKGQQVASTNQAFRLMHQKETKSLEFNPRPQPELAQNYNETETY